VDPSDDGPITLSSSLRGLAAAYISPLLVLALAAAGFVLDGVRPMPLILLAIGTTLLLVSLFDYPIRSVLSSNGIARHTLLRRHNLRWDRIDAITRSPGPRLRWSNARSNAADSERRGAARPARFPIPGGLAAVCGRRKVLLVDQAESAAEYDRLRSAINTWQIPISLAATRPPVGTAPTDLYRRRKR